MAKKNESDTLINLEPTETIKNPPENISKSELEKLLEEFRIGLIKLGLKGLEDLNNKRVQNFVDFHNALTAMYNAVKNS